MLLSIGPTPEEDRYYNDNISPISFHNERGKKYLRDIGACIIVGTYDDSVVDGFLAGTGMSVSSDMVKKYIYLGDTLYMPKEESRQKLEDNMHIVIENVRKSLWCVKTTLHVKGV